MHGDNRDATTPPRLPVALTTFCFVYCLFLFIFESYRYANTNMLRVTLSPNGSLSREPEWKTGND